MKSLSEVVALTPIVKNGFQSTHGVWLEPEQDIGATRCFIKIPICQHLWGTQWDTIALTTISALVQPVIIRVTRGEVTADAFSGRVTVVTDERGIIESMALERWANVPKLVEHGAHFQQLVNQKQSLKLSPSP